jgi:hypothetical protein
MQVSNPAVGYAGSFLEAQEVQEGEIERPVRLKSARKYAP